MTMQVSKMLMPSKVSTTATMTTTTKTKKTTTRTSGLKNFETPVVLETSFGEKTEPERSCSESLLIRKSLHLNGRIMKEFLLRP